MSAGEGAAAPFIVTEARYARGQLCVRPLDGSDGWKGRTAHLLDNLSARWTNRDGGYVMSPGAVEKLRLLHEAGFEGCIRFGGEPARFRLKDGGYDDKLPLAAALKLAKTRLDVKRLNGELP